MSDVAERIPFNISNYDGHSAFNLIRDLTRLIESIPEEYRTKVIIDEQHSYDDRYEYFITYYRPETPDETTKRYAQERLQQTIRETNERSQLAHLIRKYGAPK
jgi:hypothetical protein